MISRCWQHLPLVLITAMLVISLILELTAVPPLVWPVKVPLAVLLMVYLLRVRADRRPPC